MNLKNIGFIILLLFSLSAKSTVYTAVGCPGPVFWGGFTAGTCPFWNGATQLTSQPNTGDILVIPAGCTVTINNIVNVSNDITITVSGQLKFNTSSDKLNLNDGSIINVPTGGSISGSSASNQIKVGNGTAEWQGPGTTNGPFVISNGFLPIELIAFTGDLEVRVVYLKWITATETNNDYFEIEKSSDGINYTSLGKIESLAEDGNSLKKLEYLTIDKDLKHPLYYYRLKQVDLNKESRRTNAITVKIYSPELRIYPNPNNGQFKIEVPTALSHQRVDVKICDQLSQPVLENTFYVVNDNITGAVVEIIPAKPLARGIYFATIVFDGTEYRQKMIVN